jgi:putative ABC transport system substrate-binding protein
VAVILAVAAPAAVAAKAATTTIPIVFNLGDPIQFGLVASLNKPGGNLTGVAHMTAELVGKRLDLLHDLVSGATVVAALVNPANPIASEEEAKSLREATRRLGMQLHVLPASNPSEIDAAFLSLVEFRAGALVVSADTLFTNRKEQIIALAARHEVPAVYVYPSFAAAGGLMSYGDDLVESYRQAGTLAGKILQGARAADLPVQQAVKLELIINLKTAKALGLTVPQTLLARADEVIE